MWLEKESFAHPEFPDSCVSDVIAEFQDSNVILISGMSVFAQPTRGHVVSATTSLCGIQGLQFCGPSLCVAPNSWMALTAEHRNTFLCLNPAGGHRDGMGAEIAKTRGLTCLRFVLALLLAHHWLQVEWVNACFACVNAGFAVGAAVATLRAPRGLRDQPNYDVPLWRYFPSDRASKPLSSLSAQQSPSLGYH